MGSFSRLKKKNKKKPNFKIYAVYLCMILLGGLCFRGAYDMLSRYITSSDEVAKAGRELADVSLREEALKNQIASLSTVKGVEQEVRTRYNVAKKGEELYIILDDEDGVVSSTTPDVDQGFIVKVYNFLFR